MNLNKNNLQVLIKRKPFISIGELDAKFEENLETFYSTETLCKVFNLYEQLKTYQDTELIKVMNGLLTKRQFIKLHNLSMVKVTNEIKNFEKRQNGIGHK